MSDSVNVYIQSVGGWLLFAIVFFSGYLLRWFFAGKRIKAAEERAKSLTASAQKDAEKLKNGIIKSTGKTTITLEQVEEVVKSVEAELKQEETTEIESIRIGQLVADQLKDMDKVAYIRFASVFRRFVDAEDFEKELKKLL